MSQTGTWKKMCLVRFLSCGVCVYCWRNLIGHMHAALVWSAFLENLRPSPLAHGKGIIRFWDRGPWFRASSPHWKNRCEALSSVLLLALVFTLVYRQVPGGSRRTAALALHIRPTLDSCEPTCYILQKQFDRRPSLPGSERILFQCKHCYCICLVACDR